MGAKLVSVLLVLLAALPIPPALAEPRYGGTLTFGSHTEPTLINPVFTTHSISVPVMQLVFNSLLRPNSRGEMEPDLAESWEVSDDGKKYTFHLRKGVKFHDGVECTAEDVKFTYDAFVNPVEKSPFCAVLSNCERFEAAGKYTFVIYLKKASPAFILRTYRHILPKHLYQDYPLRNHPLNFRPVGTGLFKFKEWKKSNEIVLEANPDYFEGRPYLDRIVFKSYPSVGDCWIALMRSEIDLTCYIEKKDFDILRNDSNFRTFIVPTDSYFALFYNPQDPITSEIAVRRAIAHAIDKQDLIRRVSDGYGLSCSGPFNPETLGFNPEVKPFEYDPDQSIALLAKAGWTDQDNDGILEREGKKLELRILVNRRKEGLRKILACIRQHLQEVGMKVEVILYDDESSLTSELLERTQPQAILKLFLAGLDPDQMEEDWCPASSQISDKTWVFRDREVERLFWQGKVSVSNREAIYRKIHQILFNEQPVCFLYTPSDFFAISSRIACTDAFFNINMPFNEIKNWYVKDERR